MDYATMFLQVLGAGTLVVGGFWSVIRLDAAWSQLQTRLGSLEFDSRLHANAEASNHRRIESLENEVETLQEELKQQRKVSELNTEHFSERISDLNDTLQTLTTPDTSQGESKAQGAPFAVWPEGV